MFNNKVAYQQYQKVQVETANQGSLIIMLYQGCIKFLRLANKNLDEHNYAETNRYLIKAQDIISELNNTLDMENGGAIAENLDNLYDFMLAQLIQANVKKDPQLIKNVEDLMMGLLEAWQQVVNG